MIRDDQAFPAESEDFNKLFGVRPSQSRTVRDKSTQAPFFFPGVGEQKIAFLQISISALKTVGILAYLLFRLVEVSASRAQASETLTPLTPLEYGTSEEESPSILEARQPKGKLGYKENTRFLFNSNGPISSS